MVKKRKQQPRRPQVMEPDPDNRLVVHKTIKLYSRDAQDLVNITVPVCIAFFRIGIILQRFAEEVRVLSLLESLDEEIFKPLSQDLQEEYERLKLLAAEHGLDMQAAYIKPVTATLEISHPYGLEYLKLVETMDGLFTVMGNLWFSRILNDVEYNQAQRKWWTAIRQAGIRICRLAKDTLAEYRKQQPATASEEEKTPGLAEIEMKEPAEGLTETGATPKAAGVTESPPKAAGRKHRQAAEDPVKAPEPSSAETEIPVEAATLQ
jgi:hypothetical protein